MPVFSSSSFWARSPEISRHDNLAPILDDPPNLLTAQRLDLFLLLPRTSWHEMRFHEAPHVLLCSILSTITLVRICAKRIVISRLLPRLARKRINSRIQRRENGGVGGQIGEARIGGRLHARKGGEGREAAVGTQDVAEGDGGLD
ncbi:hypothetical protein HG531_008701 [Fusarium graminearum]|nr:hypothetical protein HG531_008701 [Fusarium graminearum]